MSKQQNHQTKYGLISSKSILTYWMCLQPFVVINQILTTIFFHKNAIVLYQKASSFWKKMIRPFFKHLYPTRILANIFQKLLKTYQVKRNGPPAPRRTREPCASRWPSRRLSWPSLKDLAMFFWPTNLWIFFGTVLFCFVG